MLIAKIIWGHEASIIDVEVGFLQKGLTELIYMIIPEGMNEDQDHFLQLKKDTLHFGSEHNRIL
jgi:hypothetical protein